jgi:hypothetical protein
MARRKIPTSRTPARPTLTRQELVTDPCPVHLRCCRDWGIANVQTDVCMKELDHTWPTCPSIGEDHAFISIAVEGDEGVGD